MRPFRALLHPAWLSAVVLLALNDHLFKTADVFPSWFTGKASDFAGLFAAPMLLAALLRVRSRTGLLASYLTTGAVFSAIKTWPAASAAFEGALALAHIPWRNTVDPTDLVGLVALCASWAVLVPRAASDLTPRPRRLEWVAVALGLPVIAASGNAGGANSGGHAPGSGDDGVYVGGGEIAVAPSGLYFLSKQSDRLVLGTLERRTLEVLSTVGNPGVVAFWSRAQGEGFFVVVRDSSGDRLLSYNVSSRSVVWSRPLPVYYPSMKANEKDGSLVVWSDESLRVLDPESGAERGAFAPSRAIRDVDVRDIHDQIVVTTDTWWEQVGEDSMPRTTVHVLSTIDATATCEVTVPNCADELVIARGGTRAFLAPTWCARDPVSVIDLTACQLHKQLPGFGPVALSQNGSTAVAFLDRDTNDPSAPPMPAEVLASDSRYHLMFIGVGSLDIGTLAVGVEMPRYTVTPDGKMLLVDAFMSANNVRILDMDTRTLRDVEGAYVLLDDYVTLPDSRRVYGIHQGLFEIDVPSAKSRTVGLPFTPEGINMTPLGKTLLLRDRDELVHLFDIEAQSVIGTMGE